MHILKPFIKQLIKYHYSFSQNSAGGVLHIATDDGNLEDGDIFFCQEKAEKEGDHLALLIAEVLRCFTVEEREKMYDDNWWGMKGIEGK